VKEGTKRERDNERGIEKKEERGWKLE